MIRHSSNTSESWKSLPWKKFRGNLFRLQKKVFKAVQAGDMRKARSLQKLILKSFAARFLAIRQVTQLNGGRKRLAWMEKSPSHLRDDSPWKSYFRKTSTIGIISHYD